MRFAAFCGPTGDTNVGHLIDDRPHGKLPIPHGLRKLPPERSLQRSITQPYYYFSDFFVKLRHTVDRCVPFDFFLSVAVFCSLFYISFDGIFIPFDPTYLNQRLFEHHAGMYRKPPSKINSPFIARKTKQKHNIVM